MASASVSRASRGWLLQPLPQCFRASCYSPAEISCRAWKASRVLLSVWPRPIQGLVSARATLVSLSHYLGSGPSRLCPFPSFPGALGLFSEIQCGFLTPPLLRKRQERQLPESDGCWGPAGLGHVLYLLPTSAASSPESGS